MKSSRWLKLRNIEAWKENKRVCSNISVDFYYGQNIAILGPNGSGKTTLLKLINRSLYPIIKKDSEIKIFEKQEINIWKLRRKIGFFLDELDHRIDNYTTVQDTILSGYYGKFKVNNHNLLSKLQLERLENILSLFELNFIRNRKYRSLSQGEKKRTMIARAIINKPDILILDEPTNNLDLKSNWNLLELLNKISQQDINIIQVTHNVETIIKSINRVIFLKSGSIIDDGPPNELLTSEKLSKLYELPITVIKAGKNWRLLPESNSKILQR